MDHPAHSTARQHPGDRTRERRAERRGRRRALSLAAGGESRIVPMDRHASARCADHDAAAAAVDAAARRCRTLDRARGVRRAAGRRIPAGAAAYHLIDSNAALAAYERAVRSAADEESKAQALYNGGNVLARLARYDDAGARYRSALQLQPNFSKAGFNLTLVNQLLEQRRGLRTREDSKRSLPAGTAAPRADAGRAAGHGGDREQAPAGSPIPQGNAAEKQQRSAAREQITGPGDRSAPQAAELQQTLTLWRDAAARGGPAELDSLRDGNTEFLRWRFREDDLGKHVKKTEDKPW